MVFRIVRGACWALVWLVALGCVAWAFGALHCDFPVWKNAAAWTFVALVLAAVIFSPGRILLNGKGDEMMYERGTIETGGLPFAELKKRALIDAAAKAAGDSPDFSRLIREGRPGFASPSGCAGDNKTRAQIGPLDQH